MNTMQLETFLAVADTLSFARAAEKLHVTQPAVTHQVRSLEAELGAKLFNRTTRHVHLTEPGRIFLADAQTILNTSRRAKRRFREGAEHQVARFAVGCRSYAHTIFLDAAFAQMAASHAGLHPDISMVPYDGLHQLLENGEVDVVLDFEGFGRRGTTFSALMDVETVCLCPAGSPLLEQEAVWTHDLENLPIALIRPRFAADRMRDFYHEIVGNRAPQDQFVCESVEAAITLVRAGLAVSVQPAISVPPDIARVPFYGIPTATFGIYTSGGEPAGLAREFYDLLRARLTPR